MVVLDHLLVVQTRWVLVVAEVVQLL